jgi:CRISPR/Cas system endoribonuclease Cas6 (RAMP superfamily)
MKSKKQKEKEEKEDTFSWTELYEQERKVEKNITPWKGTSYHGDCFLATINELKTIFDSPDRVGDKKDKVQYEWLLDLEVSNTLKTSAPITIYDWKEYRDYHKDEYIRFHIGGFSSRITKLAKKEIEKVLTIYNNQDE